MTRLLKTAQAEQKYFLVGHGCLGQALLANLLPHTNPAQIDRSDLASKSELQSLISSKISEDHKDLFFLLAVSDPAIESVAQQIIESLDPGDASINVHFVYFSASKKLKLPSSELKLSLSCFHPLYSFTGREISEKEWARVPFIYDSRNSISFRSAFAFWDNETFQLSQDRGPLYHALAVTGGNLPFNLIDKAAKQLSRDFNLPKKAVVPFLHSLLKNFESSEGPVATGPLGRQDAETLNEHLNAIKDSAILHTLYTKTIEEHWPDYFVKSDREAET